MSFFSILLCLGVYICAKGKPDSLAMIFSLSAFINYSNFHIFIHMNHSGIMSVIVIGRKATIEIFELFSVLIKYM